MKANVCRSCGAPLRQVFCDLGVLPLANAFVDADALDEAELCYPLKAFVCDECFLVQVGEFASPAKLFGTYAYFSSYSESWLEHARAFQSAATARFGLGGGSLVVEVASNDGYLLQYFKQAGVPVLGIEPAANIAAVAQSKGIPTVVSFLDPPTAAEITRQHGAADLVVANNVLAHVPDINSFVTALALLIKPQGVVSLEFPHLSRLLDEVQFDTIYHEHFSYLSFTSVVGILSRHGLGVFDVEELPTHGGSLRVLAQRTDRPAGGHATTTNPQRLLASESRAGLAAIETYRHFQRRVEQAKRRLLSFLIDARDSGRSIVAYGAAAKGSVLLNYAGIRGDFIDYVVDRSAFKQGKYMPGCRLPIHDPEQVRQTRPHYVLILAWNLRDEIIEQMGFIREWGGAFVVTTPRFEIIR